MKIVYDENMPAIPELLGEDFELRAVNGRSLSRAELSGVDALLVRSVTRVDAALLRGTPVRFVGSATSGVDHVDRAWLAAHGVAFRYAPGANANSVVEYVLSAIAACDDFLECLFAGGRVGIVGYGHVGRALAGRLQALGIDWCVSDPWLQPGAVPRPAALETVLSCQVICLHPELTREAPWPSFHLLDSAVLAGLHAGQLLINASRGAVIDGGALLHRLRQARPPSVVLDVWENEPRVDPELLQRVRIGTAHIAGYSLDSKVRASAMLADELLCTLERPRAAATRVRDDKPLTLPAAGDPATLLRQLLSQSYWIAQDDRLLRDVVYEAADPEKGFDRLRREYAERRELAGRSVMVDAGNVAGRDLVRALGCIPQAGETRECT